LCGLNGVTNPSFLQHRLPDGTIDLRTNPGSQAFQMQLGARFQF